MAGTAHLDKPEEMQQDLQAFASLWSSLRSRYEGTNITKTIAKLLHMYQPDDGLDAYERLLKTISMLLEDFDVNGLRTLVSMVPIPKNASEDIIKEVFFKAMGFTRLDAPMFYQNQSLIPGVVNPNNDDVKEGEAVASQNSKNNINFNLDEKKINFEKQGNHSKSPQEVYKAQCFSKTQNEYVIPQNYQKMNYYVTNHTQQGSPMLADSRSLPPGYKMSWIPSSYVMQSGNSLVGNSYTDFIVKTEDNKLVRVPVANFGLFMSCNAPSAQQNYPHQVASTSRQYYSQEQNKGNTPEKLNATPQVDGNNPISIEKQDEKDATKIEGEKEVSLLDNLTLSKNLEASIDRLLNRLKKNVNSTESRVYTPLKKPDVYRREPFSSKDASCSQNDVHEWSRELQMRNYDYAAYKRQYYDSMLNFQRTKVQASSSFTPTSYDSSCYEYLQQQWMYQQHQRLIMGQYAAQRLIQPEHSGAAVRNLYSRPAVGDWMMTSHCATSRQPQQVAKQT